MPHYQAKWGNKGFIIDPTKIVPLMALAIAKSRKTNTAGDTSGTATTNTTGIEPQKISFETIYVSGAGVDPRTQIEEWSNQFGQRHPFYLNGERFGPALLELESIDFSDFVLDNKGRILSVKCAIVLAEYVPPEAKVTTTAIGGGSGSGSGSASGSSSNVAEQKKRGAYNAVPKPSEKNKKKPINDFDDRQNSQWRDGGGRVINNVVNEKQ